MGPGPPLLNWSYLIEVLLSLVMEVCRLLSLEMEVYRRLSLENLTLECLAMVADRIHPKNRLMDSRTC